MRIPLRTLGETISHFARNTTITIKPESFTQKKVFSRNS